MKTESNSKLVEKLYHSFTAKLILLGFMFLMPLIPLEMIKNTIRERESRARKYSGNGLEIKQ